MQYLYVFLGAGLGGVLRFLTSKLVHDLLSDWLLPVGTFSVNMLGCLLIGFFAQLAESHSFMTPEIRLFLVVGMLGGFTTFSTFGFDLFTLIHEGKLVWAIMNAVSQVVLGVLLVYLGYWSARALSF